MFVWADLEEPDRWQVGCPSPVRGLRRLFGTRDHEAHKQLLLALDEVLRDGAGVRHIRDIRWFKRYETEMAGFRDEHPWFAGPVVGDRT